jgi:hypothetical protein
MTVGSKRPRVDFMTENEVEPVLKRNRLFASIQVMSVEEKVNFLMMQVLDIRAELKVLQGQLETAHVLAEQRQQRTALELASLRKAGACMQHGIVADWSYIS